MQSIPLLHVTASYGEQLNGALNNNQRQIAALITALDDSFTQIAEKCSSGYVRGVTGRDGGVAGWMWKRRRVREGGHGNADPRESAALPGTTDAAGRSLSSIEEEPIRRVLEDTHYNLSLAARVLEIDRVTLYNKMRRYGIHRPGTPSLQST